MPTCKMCKTKLPGKPHARGPKFRYCGGACRQRAYRQRKIRNAQQQRKSAEKALRNSVNSIKSLIHSSIEWFTPPEYISAVNAVLGEIELDPASCAVANQTVRAQRFFDKDTNGLVQSWHACTIFLNPPHDRVNPVGPWVQKLLSEYRAGHVEEAILLVDACTETNWFAPLYNFPLCFVRGRIHFLSGDALQTSGQIQGSVFVYLGSKVELFCRVFEPLGRIYLPLSISLF